MLHEYDVARSLSQIHETQTSHGNTAEAAVREWLSGFLPKRYGVTSGYIISPGIDSRIKAPHYDVIIYDHMESPVLWIEDSADASVQGRSLAIPAEYVYAVLEVKSRLTSTSMAEAIKHLSDLRPLMDGIDTPDERYKLHLPSNFHCGLIFFELSKDNEFSEASIAKMIAGAGLRGFFGGIVLRAEGQSLSSNPTARLTLLKSEEPVESSVKSKATPLWEYGRSASFVIADNVNVFTEIRWSEFEFSKFAFDLIAMMQGHYDPAQLSSYYGLGSDFGELMRDIGATMLTLDKQQS